MTAASVTVIPGQSRDDGFGWRVGLSILSVFGLASFALLFLAFWAGSYSVVQDVVVLFVAGIVFVAVNGAAWASWGVRRAPAVSGA